ncbi:hypothetical protein ABW20_dc0110550 [Dactylellina cionopaga]|nr:hypothetical protein ABW20_dc0110550 [Dactylellina cionopaga]
MRFSIILLSGIFLVPAATSIELNIDSYESIKAAAKIVAKDLAYAFWDPYSVHGVPHPKYYWWLHGGILGAMVDYWAMTGDNTYNENITVGMYYDNINQYLVYKMSLFAELFIGWLRGVSPNLNIQPVEQSFSEGNDDQGFWSIMSMDATERLFPETEDQKVLGAGFLEITQYVLYKARIMSFITDIFRTVQNLQAGRWDNETCGGGLRWQFNSANNGYLYKNTISNGWVKHILYYYCARLARYTKNETYAEWAEKTYKWLRASTLIQDDFWINDGADIPDCKRITTKRWSYNYGTILAGCAAMYNFTDGNMYWKEQIDNILDATYATFFDPETGAIKEIQCQDTDTCDANQPSFKGYLSRWMGYTAQVAPYTYEDIMPRLRKNALLAAATCIGDAGVEGSACGLKWNIGAQWDGKYGLGEQLSALEVIQNAAPFIAPVGRVSDSWNGGTSKPNPGGTGKQDGGSNSRLKGYRVYQLPNYTIKPADRVGAAILTILTIIILGFSVKYILD